jgi:hypothetical protein
VRNAFSSQLLSFVSPLASFLHWGFIVSLSSHSASHSSLDWLWTIESCFSAFNVSAADAQKSILMINDGDRGQLFVDTFDRTHFHFATACICLFVSQNLVTLVGDDISLWVTMIQFLRKWNGSIIRMHGEREKESQQRFTRCHHNVQQNNMISVMSGLKTSSKDWKESK